MQRLQNARLKARVITIIKRDKIAEKRDEKRKDVEFSEGELVLLRSPRTTQYEQSSKLAPKFVGYFKVMKKVGDLTYLVRSTNTKAKYDLQVHCERMRKIHDRPEHLIPTEVDIDPPTLKIESSEPVLPASRSGRIYKPAQRYQYPV